MLNYPDKEWNLTDGTSFVAMRAAGTSRTFKLGHNFSEAGFEESPALWRAQVTAQEGCGVRVASTS